MSAFITAAVVVAAGSIGSQMYAADKQKKAAKKAREQQEKDSIQARKAEVFAETEGKGQGNLGEISLEIDDTVDEEEESLRQGHVQI